MEVFKIDVYQSAFTEHFICGPVRIGIRVRTQPGRNVLVGSRADDNVLKLGVVNVNCVEQPKGCSNNLVLSKIATRETRSHLINRAGHHDKAIKSCPGPARGSDA